MRYAPTMRRAHSTLPVATIVSIAALTAATATATPVRFEHGDWELACDNTGTCRAAGYQSIESDTLANSVLFTRPAGPDAPVTGELALGEYGIEAQVKRLPDPIKINLSIDGRSHGTVRVSRDGMKGRLSADQVRALLAALPRSTEIVWTAAGIRWRLSDRGAAAALLKMDEAQGRLGTPGALLRRGKRPESEVPPARPSPVVKAVPVPKERGNEAAWLARHDATIRAALKSALPKDAGCDRLTDSAADPEPLQVERLSGTARLVSTPCWRGAYNGGTGYWVVDANAPHRAVLVTDSGTDHEAGRLVASHKGRGLGDCWHATAWVWTETHFERVLEKTTGLCRMVAAGGAWDLPTFVATVR
jgi:hypothetical protein